MHIVFPLKNLILILIVTVEDISITIFIVSHDSDYLQVTLLANHLQTTTKAFMESFTKEVDTPDGIAVALTTLGSDSKNQHCIFLKGKQCSVYEVRPTQCVTYPFWSQNVSSETDWKSEGSRCPGISMHKRAEVDEFSSDSIFKEVILHQVHARGIGMNMSHAEASEVLLETLSNEPKMVRRTF